MARYFTPNGNEIQARGITPDVIVAPDRARNDATRLVLHEEDLAQHFDATLPEEEAPSSKRAKVESTRMFGTRDDKALAAAVTLLGSGHGQSPRAGSLLGALAPSMKRLGAALKSFQATR